MAWNYQGEVEVVSFQYLSQLPVAMSNEKIRIEVTFGQLTAPVLRLTKGLFGGMRSWIQLWWYCNSQRLSTASMKGMRPSTHSPFDPRSNKQGSRPLNPSQCCHCEGTTRKKTSPNVSAWCFTPKSAIGQRNPMGPAQDPAHCKPSAMQLDV